MCRWILLLIALFWATMDNRDVGSKGAGEVE